MIDENRKEMLSFRNIIKDGNEYKLQNNYYMDGDYILSVISWRNRDNHNCDLCSHFHSLDSCGYCDVYNKLLNLPEHHFVYPGYVINCAAYDKVEKMNVIKSLDDMIAFIEKTENFFGAAESYEQYYGFERNWDEDTGEILETVREYYERGGVFENIPTQYPCVIRFDWNCKDDLEWIYIGQ